MIKLENTITPSPEQWISIIMGARNPMNSWARSDSKIINQTLKEEEVCPGVTSLVSVSCTPYISIGPNDHELLMKLAKGGSVHAKYRRMINVYVDITAPLYWWKEFDTYKIGTVANSCSTMHKIHEKEFTLEDFSCEKLIQYVETDDGECYPKERMYDLVETLNVCREKFIQTKDKKYWDQMIQLLPSSYNQKRTVELNYEVLVGLYRDRKNHKLDEWHVLCDWIEKLPCSELIIGEKKEKNDETI